MAVKTQQQLLAEAATGKPITAGLFADLIDTIFSRGAGAETVICYVDEDVNIRTAISDSGYTLTTDSVVVLSSTAYSDVTITLSRPNETPVETIVVPEYKAVAVIYDATNDTCYYFAPNVG